MNQWAHEPWSMGLLFVFGLCYALPGMCDVLRVMCCVVRWCVVDSFHARLRPLNGGLWATYLVYFSIVWDVHVIHSTWTINTELRYDNPAKCIRALVPFIVVANVACSYCLLQITRKYVYRPVPSGAADAGTTTARRPPHTIRSLLHITQTNSHRTRQNAWPFRWFRRGETDREVFGFGFGFLGKKRP